MATSYTLRLERSRMVDLLLAVQNNAQLVYASLLGRRFLQTSDRVG
jgi:hypothetical protein